MSIIIVDTETTGLTYGKHVPFEVSYIVWDPDGKMEPKKFYVAITDEQVKNADDVALEINGRSRDWLLFELPKLARQTMPEFVEFMNLLEDQPTLMGANVRFDARMLESFVDVKTFGEPWSHRLFDIQAWYSGVMGLDHVMGLNKIFADINNGFLEHDDSDSDWRITESNHDSAVDCMTVRDIFAWGLYYSDMDGTHKAPWDMPFSQKG